MGAGARHFASPAGDAFYLISMCDMAGNKVTCMLVVMFNLLNIGGNALVVTKEVCELHTQVVVFLCFVRSDFPVFCQVKFVYVLIV